MDSYTTKIVNAYKKYSKVKEIVQANLVKHEENHYIEAIWKQRNLETTAFTHFKSTQAISQNPLKLSENIGLPTVVNNDCIRRLRPDRKNLAVIKTVKLKDEKMDQQILEIWDSTGMDYYVNLTKQDMHGKIHYNNHFGALEWSTNGEKLVYIAERKAVKSQSFFHFPKAGDDKKVKIGNEHEFKHNWGEQLNECEKPTPCVFDLETKTVMTFDAVLPSDYSYAQAVWVSDEEFVVIAWKHEPFPLGLIYCTNRITALFKCNIHSKKFSKLTDIENHFSSPRFHPNCGLLYLETPALGPHSNNSRLMRLRMHEGSKPEIVIDYVKRPESPTGFPGLFLFAMPLNCFVDNGKGIVVSSNWNCDVSVLKINLESGQVTRLSGEGSWMVHDVWNDLIIAVYSTPSIPQHIRIGQLFGESGSINWCETQKKELEHVTWSVKKLTPEMKNPDYENMDYECLLMKPPNYDQLPKKYLIVNPHGGPHSAFTAQYLLPTSCFCSLGYALLQVNYRGSTGYGKDAIHSLPGNIGSQDVSDVQQAAETVSKELKCDKVFVTGGSHGGFLSLSLIGRYPEFYAAAVTRNPVCDFANMWGVSDIPDWISLETMGAKYKYDMLPDQKFYKSALSKSPIHLLDKVKTPCLMQLGELDLRVPPSQGLEWAKKYIARGGKCKILWYKGNCHPLSNIDAESDGFINLLKWFHDNADN